MLSSEFITVHEEFSQTLFMFRTELVQDADSWSHAHKQWGYKHKNGIRPFHPFVLLTLICNTPFQLKKNPRTE